MGATQGRKDGPQEKDPAIFFKAGITQKQKREDKLKKGTPHAIPDSSCVGLIQKMVVGGAISPKTRAKYRFGISQVVIPLLLAQNRQ